MGLLDKLRSELVDIVEWVDDPGQTLVWRFPRYNNEIKNGAQLLVRPGQVAVFVNQGKIADIFEPGRYDLVTQNLPIMTTLAGWKFGFNSPFRAEVYFVSTRQITGLKWGTPNPIMLHDADFGPIRLRAFGTYSLRARDAKALMRELVGAHSSVETDEIGELMRGIILTTFSELLGSAHIAALDLAAHLQELSTRLRQQVGEKIDDEYGLDVPQLNIVNVSLPPEVEKALDARTSMGVIGDMNKFGQYQMAQATLAAAQNTGGGASEGVGLGVGFAMAQRFAAGPSTLPPPIPPGEGTFHAVLGGQSQGPFTQAQLAALIAQGQMTAATLVWSPGMPQWGTAGQTPGLAALFVPPPPPKL